MVPFFIYWCSEESRHLLLQTVSHLVLKLSDLNGLLLHVLLKQCNIGFIRLLDKLIVLILFNMSPYLAGHSTFELAL